ncbi:MAG: T9SS type A sorting domain-containing protein [Bacteroidales bacterium]|jgi:alpha-tubulin suppressor-like RCC1 family protein|nr:T9SS type A sorting domain-containing protein [Bacteroidales bacterium]MDD4214179.1 T9SS type A sorting domain-containing protein [Bacteroidales bacterium]
MKNKITLIIIVLLFFLGWSNIAQAQKIAAGGWHSVVVCSDSTAKAFGENATGELGNGTNSDSNIPVSTGLTNIIAVSAGGDQLEAHSMALKSDGTVWAWGSNLYGQLGNASTTNTNTPVQTLLLTNIIAISAGGWHSVALKNDSTVWTWGWNMDGQLGDGSTNDKIIAGQVPGLTGITQIAAGTYHVLALKNDGTVWAWGDNISGQIGNGSTGTDVKSPVQVSGLTDVVSIYAGRFFSLAVKNDSTVWTWGENLYGQLGDGTNNDKNIPVQVSGLTGIIPDLVATGAFHCMAVKNDNTVWAWGRNTYGNLGDNSVTHRSLPVQMIGMSDVGGMAAGTNFSILYKTDGTFWGCGRNLSGQLGDGTFNQHNILTQSNGVCPIILSVEEDRVNNFEINAFPNPSSNGVFLLDLSVLNRNISELQIDIYDMIGKKVFSNNVNIKTDDSSIFIDISEQTDGIYFLNLQTNGFRVSQKLIKQ